MGFTINFHGSVGTVYNINVAAGATLHIGGSSKGGFRGSKCPIKTNKQQRTKWATACATTHTPPEGWNKETFTCAKAFTNETVPEGLKPGDTIFYYKESAEKDIPSEFTGVYSKDGMIIIVPKIDAQDDNNVVDDDDGIDGDSSLELDEEDIQLPTSSNIINDNDDLLEVDDDDDEEDALSPF